MSNLRVQGNVSGSGTITLVTPNTNSTYEVLLPASSGTMALVTQTPSFNTVTFPAAQVASADANTLDDYEEGTWTPTVVGTSGAGTVNYILQVGRYTKIGNRVFFQFSVAWNSGTGTGFLRVTGLPFANASGTGFNPPPTLVTQNVTLTANHYATGDVPHSQSRVDIYSCPVGGGAIADVAYDAAGEIYCSGHYFVT